MTNIFRKASGDLMKMQQQKASSKLPDDYLDHLDARRDECKFYTVKDCDFAGPHYLVYGHCHIRMTNGEINCCCEIHFSYTKNWLLKLQSGMKIFGYKSVLSTISLDHPIPDHRSEIPITTSMTLDEQRSIGFFYDGS